MKITNYKIVKNIDKKTDKEIILRQITDHIVQCLQRIEDDIQYIVFLRRNSKIQSAFERFYLQQIDRFSRDVLVTFNQILDKDPRANTFHSLINEIGNSTLKTKMRTRLEILRKEADILINHRNKVIAHHETFYNSQLADYYLAQPFSHFYVLNPCFCMRLNNKLEKFFYNLHNVLGINGIGMLHIGGEDAEKLFRGNYLGKDKSKKGIQFFHRCRYKDCLLKN